MNPHTTAEDNFDHLIGKLRGELWSYIQDMRSQDQTTIKNLRDAQRKASLNNISEEPEHEYNVLCLIDGSSISFAPSLLMDPKGGTIAARKLASCLSSSDHLDIGHPLHITTYYFMNKRAIVASTGVPGPDIDRFISCFNEAAEHRTFMLSVANGAMVVARIKDLLMHGLKSSDTWRIVLAGCGSDTYTSLLEAYDPATIDEKVLLLRHGAKTPSRASQLDLCTIKAPPALFEAVSTPASATTLDVVAGAQDAACIAERTSAASPLSRPESSLLSPPTSPELEVPVWRVRGQSGGSPTGKGRALNPSIKIWENDPPPCNMYYLLGTCWNKFCQRGHDYEISEADKTKMRIACRNRPCDSVKNGTECGFGDDCLFGHYCRWGLECRYLSYNKCVFGGAEFHQDQ